MKSMKKNVVWITETQDKFLCFKILSKAEWLDFCEIYQTKFYSINLVWNSSKAKKHPNLVEMVDFESEYPKFLADLFLTEKSLVEILKNFW